MRRPTLTIPFRDTSRERFRPQAGHNLSASSLEVRRGATPIGIKKPDDLRAIERVLASDIPDERDVIVAHVHRGGVETEDGKFVPESLVGDHKADIFSEIVFSAEKIGKPVKLLSLPGDDWRLTLLEAAGALDASDLWLCSSQTSSEPSQRASLEQSWRSLDSDTLEPEIVLVAN